VVGYIGIIARVVVDLCEWAYTRPLFSST
jgi:hypothetical protein